ncbi:serine hydrolase domain-containing protein [Halalkalicoccus jeotgali]|uniref:Beta-lactamase n=1 Tax=Halalkalicoccus jeotgali (strain DSM 18796 / CECT 7217 / JCM 14584 / KCTC 4019 / B3) TaxID=795797 RepID=D8JC98_HALJB|nr:serine hydrolase domain-containing protein [Halalkalicoccus jeotgali]ADJ17005.1 beta-lactamase [Halalkalicoccus jeotgali B3]ELY38833.1 beta-lactamase [Halalkalicoccus jeotgali B3]
MANAVNNGDIVGATVTVVHSGETVLTKGYGQTEANGGESVGATMPFRIGSITKPVVWTAAMQLIEAGKIDPQEDIQAYLDSVSVPGNEPITMANLATHTAGFEERNQGLWVSSPDKRRSLPGVLKAEQPAQVRPPGETFSYSNYGSALAGQVIAEVTGQKLGVYIREHIFEPLEMDTASIAQPADPSAIQGYTALAGSPTVAPGLALELWPAGSMTASAVDMSRFMRAHLANAETGERGLSLDVVTRMREQWFTHHPAVDGVGFGWIETAYGNVQTLWHNGAIPGSFYSHLVLVPDADLGLFVSYNTDTGAEAAGELINAFLNESVGLNEPPERKPSGRPDHADELTGTYRGLRIAETSHSKLFTTLQAGEINVAVEGDQLITKAGGGSTRWIERDPLVFDKVDGHETLAFSEDISQLYLGYQAFERRSWSESLALHGALGAGSILGILAGTVGPPLAARVRQFCSSNSVDATAPKGDSKPAGGMSADSTTNAAFSRTEGESDTAANSADIISTDDSLAKAGERSMSNRLLAWLASPEAACRMIGTAAGLSVVFVIGLGVGLAVDPTLFSNPPLWYRLLLVLPPLATLITAVSVGSAIVTWRAGSWRPRTLITYCTLTMSTAVSCWLLYYWNLFGIPG